MQVIGSLLLSLCCTLPAPVNQDSPAERARKQADEHYQALVKKDYDRYVDYMHPRVVEASGGRDQFVALTKVVMELLKETLDFDIRAYTVEAPGPIVEAGGELFTVLPCSIEAWSFGNKITGKSYLIGVSNDPTR